MSINKYPSVKRENSELLTLSKEAYISPDFLGMIRVVVQSLQMDTKKNLKEVYDFSDEFWGKIRLLGDASLERIGKIYNDAFPGLVSIFEESAVSEFYREKIIELLEKDPNAVIVAIDQYYYANLKKDPALSKYKDRIQYFSVTRSAEDSSKKVARIGDKSIENQLKKIKETLPKNGKVYLLDDCTVTGGTLESVKSEFENVDIPVVDTKESILFLLVNRDGQCDKDFVNVGALSEFSFASAEQREFGIQGGATLKSNLKNTAGYQVPQISPFNDGAGVRLKNMIHFGEMSKKFLRNSLNDLQKVENLISQERNEDFSFKMFDLKRVLPTDKNHILLRSYIKDEVISKDNNLSKEEKNKFFKEIDTFNKDVEKGIDIHKKENTQPSKYWFQFMRKTNVTDFMEYVISKIDEQPKPKISNICADIDGTMVKLHNETGVGFFGSKLEENITKNSIQLISELKNISEKESEKFLKNLDTEEGLVGYFTQNFKDELIKNYWEECEAKIRKDFLKYYGKERGDEIAESFIASEAKEYHIFRYKIWDFSEISDIYSDIDNSLEGKNPSRKVFESIEEKGGKVTFITAAPKIHALKILHGLGFDCNNVDLYTVEDLYDPEKKKEGIYDERKKDSILKSIQEQLKEEGRDSNSILMIGDQFKSDIKPAQDMGLYTYPVHGPNNLKDILKMIKIV